MCGLEHFSDQLIPLMRGLVGFMAQKKDQTTRGDHKATLVNAFHSYTKALPCVLTWTPLGPDDQKSHETPRVRKPCLVFVFGS